MDDLISRQAAIDEIEYELEMINSALDSITLDFNARERLRQRRGEAREILNSIQQLPSAQPETHEKRTETRACDCISRQAAIDAVKDWYDGLICGSFKGLKKRLEALPSAQQWIPVSELPNDNREVEVTCEVKQFDGKKYRYTCHASYVHRYSIESTGYNNWEECDEYNEEEDMYYALPGWYERVHNWDDYSYCAIEDCVLAWRELPEPFKGEQEFEAKGEQE